MSLKQQEIIEAFIKKRDELKEARRAKAQNYRSFLSACRYVEDAHEVVPFPKEMQDRLFSGGAVILINEEILSDIRKEFAA